MRPELFLGGAAGRLFLQHRVDRGELAAHGADLVLGLPELVAVAAGFGGERNARDRGDHAGNAGHDREPGRARRDADRARGERSQPAR